MLKFRAVFEKWQKFPRATFFAALCTYCDNVDGKQRKVSLSTLQSKAAKRRDDAHKQPRVAKKKTTFENSVSKANGFTGMTDKTRAAERNRIGDQMELEVMQLDSIQPRRKRVSFTFICL